MPIHIKKLQHYSYYIAKYHIPVFSELAVTFVGRRRFNIKYDNYKLRLPDLFSKIEIETFNRCNNDCQFCPANRNVDIRKPTYMGEELFSSIIDQLEELNYSGTIYLHHNNEPLLDMRLEKFIAEAVQKLPKAKVEVWTNGKILTKNRLRSLYEAGLRLLLVDNYHKKLTLLPHIKKVLDEIKGHEIERNMNILVWLRYKDAILTNRAGEAPNKKRSITRLKKIERDLIHKRGCRFPFEQLNINPEGKVHICCYDVYCENIVGDLKKERIVDVWRGPMLTKIRQEILKRGRKNILLCRRCDHL